jgi:hypothetical protein
MKKKENIAGCEELVSVFVTPFRCSRGHLVLNSRPVSQTIAANCDRRECQDNGDEPIQVGPRQKAKVIVWSKP